MLTLDVATSIDALAVGVSFAFLFVDILLSVFIISLTTFVIAFIGVKIGHFLGKKFKSKAEIFGGLVLLVMAVKILHEHGVFLSANFRLLDYNLTKFVFFKRVIIEC